MKKLSTLITIIFLTCAALFWISPYWMLYQIHQGIEQNQADKIAQFIDFPSVRKSLKPQIKEQIDQKLGLTHHHKKNELFGFNLTEKIADKTVEFAVTPRTINLLLQGKQLKDSVDLPNLNTLTQNIQFEHMPQPNIKKEAEQQSNQSLKEKGLFDHARYISWNEFEVTIEDKNRQIMSKNRFIFKRQGLGWKMKEIYLK